MEEARGETFIWYELKENFIKDFNFEPQNENLVETAKQIKAFVQPTKNKTLRDNRTTINCNNIQTRTITQSTRLQLENEKLKGKVLDGNQIMSKRPNLFTQYSKLKQPTRRIPTE